jgi:DNA-binding LacI/PurR family transcriptional regulator
MTDRVTLADIAQHLGVSKSSVSLALNSRPGVSEELRQRVVEVARRMGYEGKATYTENSGKSRVVLLLHQEHRANQGITGIRLGYVEGIQDAASAYGFQVVVDSLAKDESVVLSLEMLKTSPDKVLGILLVGMKGPDDPNVDRIRQMGPPFVIVNRYCPDCRISFVGTDFRHAEAEAVEYLSELGHRKIAFVGLTRDTDYSWYQQRRDGYLDGLASVSSLSDDRFLIETENVQQAVVRLLDQASDATAICAASDDVAVQLLHELKHHGRRVPQDMSVIGFDNDLHLFPSDPPLTTFDFNEFEIGYLAVRTLAELHGNTDICCLQVIVNTNLVERNSCALPQEAQH